MNTPDDFSRYYAELLDGIYDCVDRIVLNAFFSMGQTGGGMRSWWRNLHGDDSQLDDKHLREMAGTFSRRLHAFCAKQGIPIIEAGSGERKHELAEPHVPKDPTFSGLFLVITGNAPGSQTQYRWADYRSPPPQELAVRQALLLSHHGSRMGSCDDPHVWLSPFGAQLILNGHEWVEREARRKCLTAVKDGNCFVEGSDFDAVNRLAARLHQENAIGRLRELCERWIYSTCLCFALTHEEQKRSAFAYQYSVFQLELSRNLLFLRGTTMNEVYQKLIDRTRAPLDLKQVKTIFGFSHRPHKIAKRGRPADQVVKAVEAQSYDLTVFKIKWGNLTLKIYDKGGRVLRIEVVVHNVKDLRSGKILDKLPELLKRMREMLIRFLGTVQAAHVAFLDEGAFERWSKPTQRGTRRLAGIDLNKARNRHVVDAVVALSTRPGGFTLAQVAEAVQQRAGLSAKAYSSRNAAYDLAKLKGKKLVHRVKASRRYKANPSGVRAMCAYLILRDKVIKPLLAGVVRPFGRPPKVQAPVDQHYVRLREELNRTFETIGLAPA